MPRRVRCERLLAHDLPVGWGRHAVLPVVQEVAPRILELEGHVRRAAPLCLRSWPSRRCCRAPDSGCNRPRAP
eukprot:5061650-Pyramimonas_sp.AAC.1